MNKQITRQAQEIGLAISKQEENNLPRNEVIK
jgi:hypothetical protein